MKSLNAPRQPFIGLAMASALGIAIADWLPCDSTALVGLIGSAAAIGLWRCNSTVVYGVVVLAAFALHSGNVRDSPGQNLAARLGSRSRVVNAVGVVDAEPNVSPAGFSTFLFKLREIEVEGRKQECRATVMVRWRGTADFGDAIAVSGMAEPIPPAGNPGEFDMRAYLGRRDVHTQLFARYAENGTVVTHGSGNPIIAAAQKSRRWMQAVLSNGLTDSPDVQALINGMVLGIRHETPEDIEEPFQQTGTLHLFAVAGLHVGIVAQLLWIAATIVRLPRKSATALIIPCLLFYAAITGLHTSSVRAAVMSSVLLGGYFAERKVFAFNSLAAAAVLILCYDTQQLFSTGFQLSFAVVASIILFADPITNFLERRAAPDPFLPRRLSGPVQRLGHHWASWLARATAVSLAAWAGSLAFILWYFYLLTPVALFANLVVVPIAFFVLAVGMLSLISAPLSGFAALVFNNANWSLAKLIIAVVHLFAHVPLGHAYIEHPHWPDGARATITVLDAGTGAATHVRSRHADWMFDTGSARDYERSLREYLHSRGVNRLDGISLSHGDSQHIGGASALLADFRPRTAVDFAGKDRSRIHTALISQLTAGTIQRRLVVAGDEIPLSREVTARFLFPPAGFNAKRADDQALVVQLCLRKNQRVLLMSDSGVAAERALLDTGRDLRSDVLVKGQHHSDASGGAAFLEAVRPRLIIASSRDFPQNERVNEDWAAMVQLRGITLFRQDETGAVELRFFRDHWEAKAHIGGGIFRSSIR